MNLRSWLILANLLALQIDDVLSTNHVLASESRAFEANPIMAGAQAGWGDFWWIPKALIMVFIVALARYLNKLPLRTSLCVGAFYTLIVINNIGRFI